jgi:Pyruvate/2-oxoacid:ferredoxin oxidoreductase gamma subunit
MSLEAARKLAPKVRPDTLVILDATSVPGEVESPGRLVRLPITATAASPGSKVVANIVALAALNALAHAVSPPSLYAAVAARVPPRFRELNQKAAQAGEALGAQAAPAPV